MSHLQPDLAALVSACCGSPHEANFARFRLAWQPFLEAVLAIVGPDWERLRQSGIYEFIYAEYREVFSETYRYDWDYESHLIAIAYAHLFESLYYGVTAYPSALGDIRTSGSLPQHQVNVTVFRAILGTGTCRWHLLVACFPASTARSSRGFRYGMPPFCPDEFRRALKRLQHGSTG